MLRRAWRGVPLLVWAAGLLAGLAVGGWALQGDFLLNWDQVIGPEIPVPPGLWGLGPELPRRTPFYVPLALASRLIGGPQVIGLLIIASTMLAVTGATRLAGPSTNRSPGDDGSSGRRPLPDLNSLLAGLVYGLSPFLLSRSAVGHLPLMVAAALLPWLAHGLAERSERSLIRWAVVFGMLGSSGTVLGLIPIGLALLNKGNTFRDRLRQTGFLVISQASWVAPGLVAVAAGVPLPSSPGTAFDLETGGVGGIARVFAGGGFFLQEEDVAYRAGSVAAVLGLVLLGAGVIGLSDRWSGRWGCDPLLVGAVVGAGLVFLPSIPLLGDAWGFLIGIGPLGILRESQKFWPLLGLALVVGLANLLRSQCGDVAVVLGLGIGGLLLGSSWPGLFGADGRLVGVESPEAWAQVEQAIEADPGRLAVFPWRRYDRLALAEGRTVLQPAPWVLSGTVLISGDAGNAAPSVERREGLETELASLDEDVRAGREIAPALRQRGVRWLLVLNDEEAAFYHRLGREAGVSQVLEATELQLYRITPDPGSEEYLSWPGSALPLRRVDGAAVWDRSCERGWLVNLTPVNPVSVDSSLGKSTGYGCDVPSNAGLLWYPPALLSLGGLLLSAAAAVTTRSPRVGKG